MKVFQNGPDELHEICGSKKNAESCFHTYNLVCFQVTANSLRASDRFVQPVFLRIFRCIGVFNRGNVCDIYWSAITCTGDSWPRTYSIFLRIWRVFTLFLIWPNFVQKKVRNKRNLKYQKLTKNPLPKLESDHFIYPQFYIDFIL